MFTTTISVLILKEIESIIKYIKTDFIYIDQSGNCFGFDQSQSVFFSINSKVSLLGPFVFDCLELKNLLKSKSLSDSVSVQWGAQYNPLKCEIESKHYLIYNLEYIKNSIFQIINSLDLPKSNFPNLENNEKFCEIISMPALKGNGFLVLDKFHIISLHKGLLPVNKGDIVNLEIVDINNRDFLTKFTVIKKKNIIIEVYMKCCRLF